MKPKHKDKNYFYLRSNHIDLEEQGPVKCGNHDSTPPKETPINLIILGYSQNLSFEGSEFCISLVAKHSFRILAKWIVTELASLGDRWHLLCGLTSVWHPELFSLLLHNTCLQKEAINCALEFILNGEINNNFTYSTWLFFHTFIHLSLVH